MGHDLLIIDGDDALNRLLEEYLGRFGHRLKAATTAAAGLAELRRRRPELVILDVMLPDKDGLTLCKEIRGETDVPILMLTARGEVADRVVGLELGADDYLPKAGVELLVADDGPGVLAGDIERIFEPFVKLDPARGHCRGYGLGLNLCRQVVEAHRGSIEVLANPGGGTVVRVVVPRWRSAAA